MKTAEEFQTIEGTKESFDAQVTIAQQDGWKMLGQPYQTLVEGCIRYSVHMIRRPKVEVPRRRTVSMGWV